MLIRRDSRGLWLGPTVICDIEPVVFLAQRRIGWKKRLIEYDLLILATESAEARFLPLAVDHDGPLSPHDSNSS
jgi:hypothetical protein